MKVIECKNITKTYRNCNAVDNLSIEIEENTITGLIGRNGAGKTTLLKLLSGFLKPTSGEVKTFNENPFNNLEVSRNTIFIDENMSFPKSLTLTEIMEGAKSFYDSFNDTMGKRLMEYFSLKEDKKYSQLSKGMKSTFNMIVGISSHCALTIMDEPTTGMDAAVRKDFYKIVLKDYIENPRTIIISSHHLEELEDILEDILLLKDGEKFLHMPLVDLKEYAIGLRGKEGQLRKMTQDRSILHEESFGKDCLYIVMETTDYQRDFSTAKEKGIEAKPVSPNDLCIYLTDNHKGGIQYVFSK